MFRAWKHCIHEVVKQAGDESVVWCDLTDHLCAVEYGQECSDKETNEEATTSSTALRDRKTNNS